MGNSESKKEPPREQYSAVKTLLEEDEPDEWDKRIFSTGCALENAKLTDCYRNNGKDWRLCIEEMKVFKECWKRHGNVQRTDMKDLESS